MRLFIAEKPELARSITEGLGGGFQKKDGYFQSGNDVVTYCFGHMLQLLDPEDYDPVFKKWDMTHLPIIHRPWRLKPIPKSKSQLKIILDLIKSADEIINAGDPDEEGQLLVDEILEYSGSKKPIKRLLINDNNINVVKKSLNAMRDNREFKSLYHAALARSVADQLYGYNLTRLYSLSAQKQGHRGVLSVGRVQTPILGLVVNRDRLFENHTKSLYYEVSANFKASLGYKGKLTDIEKDLLDDKGRLIDEAFSKKVAASCSGKDGKILQAETKSKKAPPPLPYNLLNLQADAHRKFGIKPDKTLQITQDLREKHQLITYNRSDCQYLSDEQHADGPQVTEAIKANLGFSDKLLERVDHNIKSRAFNSKNVSAHHAIIPTAKKANFASLSEAEKNIYILVARAYLAQFFPEQAYDHTTIMTECEDYKFKTVSKVVTDPGWEILYKNDKGNADIEIDKADSSDDLRSLKKGERAHCESCKAEPKETKPLPRYTLATLLKDLARVSKYVEDPKIRKILLDKDKDKKGESGGIGTPATRTSIIKTLMDRGFIAEVKKSVISTPLGRKFYESLPKKAVTPDMTALWHEQQKAIISGEGTLDAFLDGVCSYISDEVETVKSQGISLKVDLPRCPQCKDGLLSRRKGTKGFFWGCTTYPECKATFPDSKGKPDFRVKPKAQVSSKYLCEACGSGLIRRKGKKKGSYFWGCSAYPNCKEIYFDRSSAPVFKGENHVAN